MEPDAIADFRAAVEKCRRDPSLLDRPDLLPFKQFLVSTWGVKVPAVVDANARHASLLVEEGGTLDDSDDNADPERVPEDLEAFPAMPSCMDLDHEATDEQQYFCEAAKQRATAAVLAGNLAEAIHHFTEAIMSGGASALLYANRAELLLRQCRPNAAMRDCSAALEMNADSSKAYRVRGTANRRLGLWEPALRDLAQAQKLDYDEDVATMQKLCARKVFKVEARKNNAAMGANAAASRQNARSSKPNPEKRSRRA